MLQIKVIRHFMPSFSVRVNARRRCVCTPSSPGVRSSESLITSTDAGDPYLRPDNCLGVCLECWSWGVFKL